jgi:ketosteroid isomerase-like protein
MKDSSNERQIRTLIEKWASAVRARDIDGALAHHTKDMVMFDVPFPLQSKGIEAYKKTWEFFSTRIVTTRCLLIYES